MPADGEKAIATKSGTIREAYDPRSSLSFPDSVAVTFSIISLMPVRLLESSRYANFVTATRANQQIHRLIFMDR